MSYYVHNLEVEGVELLSVASYSVTGSLGEHTTLIMTAYIEDEKVFLAKLGSMQPITVFFHQEDEKLVLFSGVITKVNMLCNGDVRMVRLAGKSCSYLLDIQKRCRSFPAVGMTYSALIHAVLGEYEKVQAFMSIADQEISELIVQYEETDWEFLKRILSTLETTITPAAGYSGIYVYVGIPALPEIEVPYEILQVEKDFASYYYLRENHQQVFDMDYVKIKMKSPEILSIFKEIRVNQQLFMVKSYQFAATKSDFNTLYELQKKAGMKQKRRYPMQLIGVAVKGTVIKAQAEKVQVYLDMDKENNREILNWFPYSTLAAAPNGSGWYCMPEPGDVVRVYFPSKDSSQAIALSSVSNYEAAPGEVDKMADSGVKYFSNRHNKVVILSEEYLQVNCNGKAVMTISKGGAVTFSAQNSVYIQAEQDVHLSAAAAFHFTAAQRIVMECGAGALASLTDNGQAAFRGREVNID